MVGFVASNYLTGNAARSIAHHEQRHLGNLFGQKHAPALRPLTIQVALRAVTCHIGGSHTRRDGVNPNALANQPNRQALGIADEGALGQSVGYVVARTGRVRKPSSKFCRFAVCAPRSISEMPES